MRIVTKNLKQTLELGKKIARQLKGGEIFKLEGDLGSGKTAFVKGLAAGLGINKPVRSPTFNLLKIYNVQKNKNIRTLVHVDCYRLKKPEEIVEIGLLDYLEKPKTVTAIEWPEKIETILKKYLAQKFSFRFLKENERSITSNIFNKILK